MQDAEGGVVCAGDCDKVFVWNDVWCKPNENSVLGNLWRRD
jgi:hypothetical protein